VGSGSNSLFCAVKQSINQSVALFATEIFQLFANNVLIWLALKVLYVKLSNNYFGGPSVL